MRKFFICCRIQLKFCFRVRLKPINDWGEFELDWARCRKNIANICLQWDMKQTVIKFSLNMMLRFYFRSIAISCRSKMMHYLYSSYIWSPHGFNSWSGHLDFHWRKLFRWLAICRCSTQMSLRICNTLMIRDTKMHLGCSSIWNLLEILKY